MVTLEGIVLWNNQPDREAFGLVRKGVGQSTVLRAVETPYPKVNPIQSNPSTERVRFRYSKLKGYVFTQYPRKDGYYFRL